MSGNPSSRPQFGYGLPYLDLANLNGTLITIEGTDGVGRSVQVSLLKEWLEVQGYGVIETGWTRSELMSETIGAAKAGHRLNQLTFSLLYATDFADRMEKIIIPALRSGFVVLADRYMYTAFARSVVRGADPAWIRNVFGFALVPELVLYLKIDVDTLLPRVLRARGIDYWEAGMDLHLGMDLFESFRKYQWRLIREYNRMSREFGFVTVDATRSEAEIQARIRRRVQSLLERRRVTTLTESLAALRPLLFEPEPAMRKAGRGTPPPDRQAADGSPEGELP
ncbi:MAG TPA: thymidylate kinase [Candidatus Polarisedimenticolia bacterium]|jgi:dTMP kinase|nr:thymidylate kinase [Candidatus Polarisedimenticolia bacterium]